MTQKTLGKLIKTKEPCAECKKICKIANGSHGKAFYALYTCKQGDLCRLCAKKVKCI